MGLPLVAMAFNMPGADEPGSAIMAGNAVADAPSRLADAHRWADSVMATLTPRQRLAQLFIPRFDLTPATAADARIRQAVEADKMGGVLLGRGSLQRHADILNEARRMADVPLLVTLDGEWGPSMRIEGLPRFPNNMALGAAADESLMRAYGREVARQCSVMGIQVNFAPVLDVNSNPDNPVIGYRSLGESPSEVARLGAAYCEGLQSGGVMAVGKHFPGHGDTFVDSHKALPTVNHSVERLKAVDLVPFMTAIRAHVMDGVMVGHLRVPALDASGAPASLSKPITTRWLRDSLGFEGLTFSDALEMKGASNGKENNCISAFMAGCDVLLGSGNPHSDLEAMARAVGEGRISQADIDSRCRKVLTYKYLLGLSRRPRIDKSHLQERVEGDSKALIAQMSEKALTLLKNDGGIVPLLPGRGTALVNIGAPRDSEFTKGLSEVFPELTVVEVNASAPLSQAALSRLAVADRVVVAVHTDRPWARTALNGILKTKGRDTLGVFFINPYRMAKTGCYHQFGAVLLAYDDIPQLRMAAADAAVGKIKAPGRLPVNLEGIAPIGAGLGGR